MASSISKIVVWVLGAACAAAGVISTWAPDGILQSGADQVAGACEAAGIPAYPRDASGQPLPRPQAAHQDAERSVGVVRQGTGWVPVLRPVEGRSTVEDVGPAQ
ncbi:hypothetical protein LY474_40510 [Myxococcus stipitatus]|uniref:hypothetical protein n=1 Tax=Myxococcus stipitatus TaxID=83455 RepID=UPI001F3A5706|nr:hypothetical protein [Myxococcus stipitatus]MCE9674091.1 hypothetical protein [Myxococcus stipitatus]